ncbi:hypothetical protein L1D54_20765 [Vibrio brasiliensis]|jgi:hypothetical protein|uniref:hypothetical protein n=1 Tax=Vibrio brasiliensis TaxID=170652 RepID=UPI001EFE7347|nr:hypothetical protein [Vibrio brasiliensis]MCG9752873.1 hypothetical protein [Vibrio brasiliensis]MCG9782738.1 hypothetical protein [Vibrio brasiliensis]
MLIGWVFAICLMQNSGLFSVCQFKQSVFANKAQITDQKSDIGEQCDLTEKLLNSAKVNLEHIVITSFIALLVIVAWLISTRPVAAQFTEPIVPKSRLHLTLCVFRE